jgi:hypothetical protein
VKTLPGIAAYLDSERRQAFNEDGIFRHYPSLMPNDLLAPSAARILLVDGAGAGCSASPWRSPALLVHAGRRGRSGRKHEAAARRKAAGGNGARRDCGTGLRGGRSNFAPSRGRGADERYFRVDIDAHEAGAGHTALEQRVMQSWRWFTRDELAAHAEPYFPTDLISTFDATEATHV